MAKKDLTKKQNIVSDKQSSKKKLSNIFVACFFWLAIWQLVSMTVDSTLLLPSPIETIVALGDLAMTKSFYADVAWTIFRCVFAIILSFVLGVLAAWMSYKSDAVRGLLVLPVGFFKAVPVMAVVIYLILLMRSNWVAVAACFLMCFPIVYTNVLTGLDAVSDEFLELAKVYRLTATQTVKLVYAPSIMPQVKAAVKLIAGLSWKAVVAAEVLSIPAHSLGYGMMNSKYYLETPTLFAYVIVIIVLSMAMEKLINLWLESLDMKAYEGSKLGKIVIGGCMVGGEHRVYNENDRGISNNVETESQLNDLLAIDSKTSEKGTYVSASKMTASPNIEVKKLSKVFDGKVVLNNITKTFISDEVRIVEGPSGSGKTTLARIIAGLETADSGSIEFCFAENSGSHESADDDNSPNLYRSSINNEDDAAYKSATKGVVKLSYLFQEDRLLPWLNVYDNMALSLVGKGLEYENTIASSNGDASFDRIVEMAKALELEDSLWKLPGELSGGMKHRVALGRTFLADANVMILDEPFRGLDEALKKRIVDRLWNDSTKGKTVIFISHNEKDKQLLGL